MPSDLTLRDYFAAMAMQGIFASGDTWDPKEMALFAYVMAEFMIMQKEDDDAQ